MVCKTVTLFSVAEAATMENWDDLPLKGVAEWRQQVPVLFQLVFCDGAHLALWPRHGVKHDSVLMMMHEPAVDQLLRVRALLPDMLKPKMDAVLAVVQAQRLSALVLDFDTVLGTAADAKGFPKVLAAFRVSLARVRQELAAAQLAGVITAAQPLLYTLISMPEQTWGYWDARVDHSLYHEHGSALETPPTELADVADGHVEFDRWGGWYTVSAATGQGVHGIGVITPYGRWLVPPSSGYGEVNGNALEFGWITAGKRAADTAISSERAKIRVDDIQWQLLDANGVPAGPELFYFIAVVSATLALINRSSRTDDTGEVYHLPSHQWLDVKADNLHVRPDGFVGYALKNKHGLLDTDGRIVVPARYESISTFHKKTGLAIVAKGGLHGMLNRTGDLVVPIKYHAIRISTRNGPPSFIGDRVWILDAGNHLGVLSANGAEVVAQQHKMVFPGQFYLENAASHLVQVKDMAWEMDMQGNLGNPAGSVAALHASFRAGRLKSLQPQPSKPPSPHQPDRVINRQLIAAELRRKDFHAVLMLLCPDQDALQAVWHELEQTLDAVDDAQPEADLLEQVPQVATASTVEQLLFSLPLWPFPRCLLDWKSIDEINALAIHFPEHADAFTGFHWDGELEGEDISQGFAAAGRWLNKSGLCLLDIQTGGDCYDLGILARRHIAEFSALTSQLGIVVTVIE